MTISLNGTTGIITPAETVNGDETVTGNLNVTGSVTVTGPINANGGGLIKSGTSLSTATTTFTGSTSGSNVTLTASAPVVGVIQIGQVIAGTNIPLNTSIIAQVSGTPGGAGVYTLSQATTNTVSGTITVIGVDFYGIPSTAKRVTLMFNNVSLSGSNILIQLGISPSGIETTGYNSTTFYASASTVGTIASSGGWVVATQATANTLSGYFQFVTLGSNIWVMTGWVREAINQVASTMGDKTLSGVLDRVRITTQTNTDTFDAGSINILYE